MKCQNVLRQTLQSSDGFPRTVDVTCGQTVGVRSWWDAAGTQRAACHRHLDAVLTLSNQEYHVAHAREREWRRLREHELGRLNESQTLRMIRPEAQR